MISSLVQACHGMRMAQAGTASSGDAGGQAGEGAGAGGGGGLWDRDHVASLAVAGSFAGGWSRCYPSFQISKRSQQFRS